MQLQYLLLLQVVCMTFVPQRLHSVSLEDSMGEYKSWKSLVRKDGLELEDDASTTRKKRAMFIKNKKGKWPGGVISYQITNDFTAEEKVKINEAMQEYMKYTCVQFKNQKASNMVLIQNSEEEDCNAATGMKGGVQHLRLAKPGCRSKATVLHELGHSMGLIHEHQRPDRDDYVTINTQNVEAKYKAYFGKKKLSQVEDLGIPYDTESIMQYGKSDFSKNDLDTIVSKQAGKVLGPTRMDEFVRLTFKDIRAINLMYPCSDLKCPKRSTCAPANSFVGKDCKCWCEPKLKGVTHEECGKQ